MKYAVTEINLGRYTLCPQTMLVYKPILHWENTADEL